MDQQFSVLKDMLLGEATYHENMILDCQRDGLNFFNSRLEGISATI